MVDSQAVRQSGSQSVSGYCPPDPRTDWAGLNWTASLVWLVIDREKRMWAFLALLMAIIFKVRLFSYLLLLKKSRKSKSCFSISRRQIEKVVKVCTF